ncbi:MAG: endolytic transglycosylase MltG [Betaproteobacteria bacterium]
MRLLRSILFFFFIVLFGVAGFAYWWANAPLALRSTPVEFRILPGNGLRAIAGQVLDAGIEVEPTLLIALGRLLGAERSIKAGSYAVTPGITPLGLMRKLTSGDVSQAEIKLLEGWTFRQWRERLDAHPDLTHETRGMGESEILRRLGIEAPRLEGLLFPDTYLFDKHSSDLEVLARAHRAAKRRLESEWNQRASGLPYRSPYEALIMASIVEKETGREADRPLVAAVFINRLKTGMLLQTDPTVIYGMGERFDGNLRKRDLQADTPYNTYLRPGLPPTPIAMPGVASLRAALHPAPSNAVYFVARGDGSSHFSSTLEEHNRAVNRYQRGIQ